MEKLKRKPTLDHFRVRVDNDDPNTKRQAIQLIKGATRVVDKKTFQASDSDAAFACFRAEFRPTKRGFIIDGPEILVNRDHMGRRGLRFEPEVTHHEAVEMYEMGRAMESGIGFEEKDGYFSNKRCHRKALLAEFVHAFERGTADDYLEFMMRRSRQIQSTDARRVMEKENQWAYQNAKQKFNQRKRK